MLLRPGNFLISPLKPSTRWSTVLTPGVVLMIATLPLLAEHLCQRVAHLHAAGDVVGGDAGDRDGGVLERGVDQDHRDVGGHRGRDRRLQRHHVGRRDQDQVGLGGDRGVQVGDLRGGAERRGRAGVLHARAALLRLVRRPMVHGDVERVGRDARDEHDLVGFGGVCGARRGMDPDQAGGGQASGHSRTYDILHVRYSIVFDDERNRADPQRGRHAVCLGRITSQSWTIREALPGHHTPKGRTPPPAWHARSGSGVAADPPAPRR